MHYKALMLTRPSGPLWHPRFTPIRQVLVPMGFVAVAIARAGLAGPIGDGWQAASLAALQCALETGTAARPILHGRAPAAGLLAGLAALAAFVADPAITAPATAGWTHIAIYGALLAVFRHSLRPGQTPIATGLAQRIDPVLTARRRTYTRAVTWMWTAYFALQLAAAVPLALWVASGAPAARFAGATDLPLAALLFGAELAVRAMWFRGERHSTVRDMLRALALARQTRTARPARPPPA